MGRRSTTLSPSERSSLFIRPCTVVKGLVQEHPEEWERMLLFAECLFRCSPMADLGNRCPYEVVTGLKPKMPVAMVAERDREFLPVTDYVVQLQAYMRDTYQAVKRLQAAAHERVEGTLSGHLSHELYIRDAMLVNRPPTGSGYEGPVRFRPSTYPGMFKVKSLGFPRMVGVSFQHGW